MKRVIAIILLLSLAFTAFADNKLNLLVGGGTGVGFMIDNYNFLGTRYNTNILTMPINLFGCYFFDQNQKIGLCLELGTNISLAYDMKINGKKTDQPEGFKVPSHGDFTLGLATTFLINNKLKVLGQAGIELITSSYVASKIDNITVKEQTSALGLELKASAVFDLNENFKILASLKTSLSFSKTMSRTTINKKEGATDISKRRLKSAFGFAMAPSASFCYQF